MYARTSTWAGSLEAMEAWAAHGSAQVAPFVSGLPGNAGCILLIDRATGRGLTLTLWDSEESALASDQNAEQSRASTVAATGAELVDRGRYEVVARSSGA